MLREPDGVSNWVYVEYSLAGYGALWFLMLAIAVLGQTHIETGMFGLVGFPVIGLIYGIVRGNQRREEARRSRRELGRLREELERAREEPGHEGESAR